MPLCITTIIAQFAVESLHTHLIILGGDISDSEEDLLTDSVELTSPVIPDSASFSFSELASFPRLHLPLPFRKRACVVVDSALFILGGDAYSCDVDLNKSLTVSSVWKLDLLSSTSPIWQALPPLLYPRTGCACAAVDDLTILAGGEDDAGDVFTDVQGFCLSTNS